MSFHSFRVRTIRTLRMSPFRLTILALLWVALLSVDVVAQQEYARLAPFTDVQWNTDGSPRVEIDGRWYTLRAIDGHHTDRLVEFGDNEFRGQGRKRFAEDLVELMTKYGAPPELTVSLDVVDLETGVGRHLDGVAMTAGNRAEVLLNRRRREAPQRAQREPNPRPDPASVILQPEQLAADIDRFEHLLRHQFAYIDRSPESKLRIDAALKALRNRAQRPMLGRTLGISLQRIIAMTIDGHARVRGVTRLIADRALPVLFQEAGDGRVIAYRGDRSELMHPDFPYVTHIQGVEIDTWCEAASRLIPDGSDALVRRRALGLLRLIEAFASASGAVIDDTVTLTLANESGDDRHELNVSFDGGMPQFGSWPENVLVDLPENIAYTRVPSFSDSEAARAVEVMIDAIHANDDDRGWIIDIRGNRGGRRDALLTLLPCLLDPATEPAYVFNAARALRACPGMEQQLRGRGLRRPDDPELSEPAKAVIASFQSTFTPEWRGRDEVFGPWHFAVVEPDARGRRVDIPIVVLMDGFNFSAADVFLSALKGRPGVTLLGMPSGGGSGASTGYTLPGSGFEVVLSRMASYQRDGRLFDGVGVEPDVLHPPTPADLINRDDSALRRAIQLIRGEGSTSTR